VNFITTILNMRAPGMTLMRMPIFVWMTLVSSFLILFAMPVITVALVLLLFDRLFGANFFNAAAGGDPLLWQHLFWLFGHPEVYILILPSMGIVSEVLPVFSKKPLFGYPVVVFSGIAIAFMGWGVWVHHMFSTGLGPIAVAAFSVSTMMIAVPTGVKIFNWLGTMWGGRVRFATPMLFAVGFVGMFTIGGLSGVTHALSPHDRQQTDTYYVVAHFHYVLFGGALLGIFGGIYYWWPKVFGRMLSERLGKINFWLMLVGFNLAFGPMHWIGLQGLPRRTYTYDESLGVGTSNLLSTVGAFIIALGVLVFMYNVAWTRRRGTVAVADPWDGRTLEWSIPSPVPHYNFAEIPVVHDLDDYWHRKYTEDEHGRLVRIASAAEAAGAEATAEEHEVHVHLPTPSFFPLVASVGLPVMGYAIIYKVYPVVVVGAFILLAGLYAWAIEPADEPEPEPEPVPEPEEAEVEEPALVGAPAAELEAGDSGEPADAGDSGAAEDDAEEDA
jgi:cytochrome c oxidase subunit 1